MRPDMWTVTLRGVRGLRPAEQQTPWVAWACLPHPPPLILWTRPPRPGDPSSPLSKAPSSFGISSLLWLLVNRVFSFSNQHSSSLSGASTFWQGTGGVDVAEGLQGVCHLVDGAQGQARLLPHEPRGHTWPGSRFWEVRCDARVWYRLLTPQSARKLGKCFLTQT